MNVKEHFKHHSRKWDYAFMLSLFTALILSFLYIVTNEVRGHNDSLQAHPVMSAQMNRVEANQIRTQIMQMDSLLCEDSSNSFYRSELSRLITEWEKLTGQNFPRELLRCI